MKFLRFGTLLLMLLHAQSSLAQVKNQSITANFNKKNLKEVLVVLQEKSGYQFVYNDALVARYKDITIALNKESIEQSLNRILGSTGLSFTKQGNKIIISEKAQPAITQVIRGKIVDENGGPMPGANIQVLELKKTVVANNDGDFEVKVPLGTYALEASFMSYHPRKVSGIKVERTKAVELKIELIPQANALNEVVVTALGIKREEKALGFAITTVQGEQLTEALSNNWTDALSGKVAGLNLLRSNAGPAGSNRIILRGENSLSGNTEALIVIDGVIVSGSGGKT